MIKDFVRDLIRYLPSKALPGLFGIVLIPIFTRMLKPEEYGNYVLVISTISVLNIIAAEWINTSIMRFYADYEKRAQLSLFNGTVFRTIILSIVVVLLITFLTLFLIRKHLSIALYHYFAIGLLIFGFGAAYNIMQEILILKRKPNQYSFMSVWRQCVCILIGILIVLFYNLSVAGLLWGILIGIIVMLPILFRISFRKINIREYSPSLRLDMMRYGLPLGITNIAAWLLTLSDRYIIKYFRGSSEVGLYSISYSLTDRSLQLIVSLIILSSAPIVMKLWDTKGIDETRRFIKDLTKHYMIITLPAAVGLSLLSKPILKLLSTQSFYEGYKIMPMVAGSIFLYGLQRNFQLGLLFYKKTMVIMYILLISGISNIILNFFFVPKYGFVAAGYTTLFSYAIFALLIILASRRYFVFPFSFKTFVKVIISTVIMSITILFVLRLKLASAMITIVFSIIFGIFVYSTSLIMMKEINKNVFKDILSLFQRI